MVLAAGIGALGSMASSAIGALTGHGQAFRSYKYSKALQRNQFRLNQRSLVENPLLNRQGYENAGYNPLLALGSSGLGFSANATQSPVDTQRSVENPVSSAIDAMQATAENRQIKANTELVKEQAETERAKRVQMQFQNAETDVRTQLQRGDLSYQERDHYLDTLERLEHVKSLQANSAIGFMRAETERQSVSNQYELGKNKNAIDDWNAKHKGYSSTFTAGPFSYSHTGDSNRYTKTINSSSHYDYEYINGKKVRVRVYD